MLIQPAALGGGLWFIAWCVILCYVFELNNNVPENQQPPPLTKAKNSQ